MSTGYFDESPKSMEFFDRLPKYDEKFINSMLKKDVDSESEENDLPF